MDDAANSPADESSPRLVPSYKNPRDVPRRRLGLQLGAYDQAALSLAISGGFFLIWSTFTAQTLPMAYGVFQIAGSVLCLAAFRSSPADAHASRRRNKLTIGILLLACVLSIDVWRCPHSRYVRFGAIHFALDERPCANPQPARPWWAPPRR